MDVAGHATTAGHRVRGVEALELVSRPRDLPAGVVGVGVACEARAEGRDAVVVVLLWRWRLWWRWLAGTEAGAGEFVLC